MKIMKLIPAGTTETIPAAPARWFQLLALLALVAVAGCEPPEERVANYVASAEQHFDEDNLVKAELDAKNALQIEPKNADARFILARIAGAKQEFNDMATNLRIAIETRPDFIEARIELGTLYSQAGALELAEEQLAELEKLAPGQPETRILKARVLGRKGEAEQAAVELKAALSEDPDNIVAMGLLASLTSLSDIDEALVLVDAAISKAEDTRELQLLKIGMLTRSRRVDAAEEAYRSLITEYPDVSDYRFMLAKFLAEEDKIEKVEAVLMEAIEHDPTNQSAKLTLIRFVSGTQGVEQGVALLEDFLQKDPAASELRMSLADQYLSEGETEKAEAEFQKIADAEGNEDIGLTARTRIASILISKGDLEAGSAIVEEVLARDPSNAYANYLKGLINFQEGNWKGAVADLRSALRREPNNARAQWLLARTHASAGDLLLAEDAYRKLLRDAPRNVPVSLELARLLVDLEKKDRAAEFLYEQTALMNLEPRLSRALIGILIELERYDDALAEAERFSATEGNAAVGNYFRGGVFQSQGQFDNAADAFRAALEERPDAREPLQGFVSSLAAQGKLDEARDYLKNLTKQYPDNLFVKTLLGQVTAVAGDKSAAREIFETTLTDKADWLPAYAALASLDSDNPEAQIDIYQRGLQAAPGNQQMALLLGSAYERRGEYEKAIATYEDALAENPDMPIVANNLAALLSDYRQDTASHNRALQVALKLADSNEPLLLDTLGWVYYRLGDHDKAQRLLEQAVEGEPNVLVLRYHLGMNYLAQDKQQLAIEQLRAATKESEVDYPGKDIAERTLAELLGTN